MTRLLCLAILSALTGCAEYKPAEDTSSSPLELVRGRALRQVDPIPRPHAITVEEFHCSGHWRARSRLLNSGHYWEEDGNICVDPIGGEPFCRRFTQDHSTGALAVVVDGESTTFTASRLDDPDC